MSETLEFSDVATNEVAGKTSSEVDDLFSVEVNGTSGDTIGSNTEYYGMQYLEYKNYGLSERESVRACGGSSEDL